MGSHSPVKKSTTRKKSVRSTTNPFEDARKLSDENLIILSFFMMPDYHKETVHDLIEAELAKRKLLLPTQIQLGNLEPVDHFVWNWAALDARYQHPQFPTDPPKSIRQHLIDWLLESDEGSMQEDFFRNVLRIKYNSRACSYRYLPGTEPKTVVRTAPAKNSVKKLARKAEVTNV